MTELEKLAQISHIAELIGALCVEMGIQPKDLQDLLIALAEKKMKL